MTELERYLKPLGLPLEAGEWGWKDTGRRLIGEWWDARGERHAVVMKTVYRYQWF